MLEVVFRGELSGFALGDLGLGLVGARSNQDRGNIRPLIRLEINLKNEYQ